MNYSKEGDPTTTERGRAKRAEREGPRTSFYSCTPALATGEREFAKQVLEELRIKEVLAGVNEMFGLEGSVDYIESEVTVRRRNIYLNRIKFLGYCLNLPKETDRYTRGVICIGFVEEVEDVEDVIGGQGRGFERFGIAYVPHADIDYAIWEMMTCNNFPIPKVLFLTRESVKSGLLSPREIALDGTRKESLLDDEEFLVRAREMIDTHLQIARVDLGTNPDTCNRAESLLLVQGGMGK
ncbi:hypothetical protein C4577_04585 [Candidatus Parcubacteria bacterium]|nr:MAG: hypothetical protein C4577_04585 [Candidatus Parcubacteria bacterium]